jgi:ubiquinone/menaquinone biosynthesis C-methylase UbiE
MPTSADIYARTHELDEATLGAIITRLEARGKQPVFIKIINDYLDRLPLTSIQRILDLGCGTGVAARAIARRTDFRGRILGIDISPTLVEVARRLSEDEGIAERTDYRVGDTRCLDLTDATFDAIIAHTLVSHVGDPLAVLTEVTRIVRPDGWAVIFDGDYTSLTLTTGDLEYGKRMEEAIINSLAANPRVMRDMPRLLRRAGLDLVTSMPYVVAEVGKADYWAALLNSLRVLLPKAGLITTEEVQAFVDAQFKASEDGTFFGAGNFYTYVAKRPAPHRKHEATGS